MDDTEFIAHRLKLAVRRFAAGKYIIRCEAIATFGNNSINSGYQCCSLSNTERDGHKVCTLHSKTPYVSYVTRRGGDCDMLLVSQFRDAAKRNPCVKASMILALEQLC